VRPSPGIPCALFSQRDDAFEKLGQNVLRDRERMSAVIASAGLPRRPLRLDLVLRHDKVAAALFGLIERAVAAVDHLFHLFLLFGREDPVKSLSASQFCSF